jgi:hypothetical protein
MKHTHVYSLNLIDYHISYYCISIILVFPSSFYATICFENGPCSMTHYIIQLRLDEVRIGRGEPSGPRCVRRRHVIMEAHSGRSVVWIQSSNCIVCLPFFCQIARAYRICSLALHSSEKRPRRP